MKTNREFAETNKEFIDACEKVTLLNGYQDFKPSTRQASKWLMRKGIACKVATRQFKDNAPN